MSLSWKQQLKREAKKKRIEAAKRRAEIKAAAVMLAKVLPRFTALWHVERVKKLRAALDVLAGEGLAS